MQIKDINSKQLSMCLAYALLILLKNSYAQNCDLALEKGAIEQYEYANKSEYHNAIERLTKMTEVQNKNYVTAGQNSAGISIPLADAFLDFRTSNSSNRKRIDNLRIEYLNHSKDKIDLSDSTWIHSKIVSSIAYDAWIKCIELNKQKIRFNVTKFGQDRMKLTTFWDPKDAFDPDSLELEQILLSNGHLMNPISYKKGVKIGKFSSLEQVIEVSEDEALVISVKFKGFPTKEIKRELNPDQDAFKFYGDWIVQSAIMTSFPMGQSNTYIEEWTKRNDEITKKYIGSIYTFKKSKGNMIYERKTPLCFDDIVTNELFNDTGYFSVNSNWLVLKNDNGFKDSIIINEISTGINIILCGGWSLKLTKRNSGNN